MAKLVKHNDPTDMGGNECWVLHFHEHKDLTFYYKEDVEAYLGGEMSIQHGIMECGRFPSGVSHIQYYDIDYTTDYKPNL